MDLTIDEIVPSMIEMDPNMITESSQMDISSDIADEGGEMDTLTNTFMDIECDEIKKITIEKSNTKIDKFIFETLSQTIEEFFKFFDKEENKSCENYNLALNIFKKSIKNRGLFFDKDNLYSFQCFSINNFCKIPHIVLQIKNTPHRQSNCMSIIESILIVPELETELLQINQFMLDNIEYI